MLGEGTHVTAVRRKLEPEPSEGSVGLDVQRLMHVAGG